ncbi:hypothetical protein [Opitutus terrae]|uniref:hypothetical protein n=1 Tax=Opitutus terrae TaxID=107709 RepID=UPI0013051685|nr:hypothetical protein [Opitutus terrae]
MPTRRVAQRPWAEIEEGVREMRLLERERLPRITHGICHECADELRGQIGAVG